MRYNLYRQMVVRDEDEDIQWITVRGNHIPIKKGQSKGEAVAEFFNKKGENTQKTDTKKSEKSSAPEKKDTKPLDNGKKSAINNGGGGKIPKQYHSAYNKIMDTVHKSAATEVTEDDVIRNAAEVAKQRGKSFGEKEIRQRAAKFKEYESNAKRIKTDELDENGKPKETAVDTKIKYMVGGKFENGEWVGGEYTPERRKIQNEIISTQEKKDENGKTVKDKNGNIVYEKIDWKSKIPPKGQKPTLVILGGRGGSGKSRFTDGSLGEDGYDRNKYVVIDPDEYKTRLPEYKKLVDSKSEYAGLNAWEVHEESSDMKKAALNIAMKKGANVVLDGTLAKTKSVLKTIAEFKKAGYNVEGAYMHLPREVSAARGVVRGMNGGRWVPIKHLLAMKNNEDNFTELLPEFSKWSMYENTGKDPVLVAKSD